VAPALSAPSRRRAGVSLHLTSLPGPRGIGELGAPAYRFMDWMEAHRLSVWQFLPIGPTGFGNSPYQPLSVFAGNPLLIDLDLLVEWELLGRSELADDDPDEGPAVDYARVQARKLPLLARAAERLCRSTDSLLAREFDAFCQRHGANWLDVYSAFEVLKAEHGGRAWPLWPDHDRACRPGALGDTMRGRETEWHRARAVQFMFARQWRQLREAAERRGIVLLGDMPIYMALDCAEAWANPELLALDDQFRPCEVAGVPPDYFSADGQLWGNPVYRWALHAADGFRWWTARLGHALEAVDMVRLDHFRGFDAFWTIPYGAATARDGHWEPGPGRKLFDAFESAFGRVPCVAEDLGLITESVTALRKAYDLPGMQVLQFLVDQAHFDACAIEEDCVCYTGTHDNDTVIGWYSGSAGHLVGAELERLQSTVRRNVEGAGESINKAMIYLCFKTRARMAIAPLQDFLGLDSSARLNTPGQPAGNWRWRATDAGLGDSPTAYLGSLVTEAERQ
jgi:4-alpha-glucanotransferase